MHVVPKGRTAGAKSSPTPGRMTLSNVVRGRLSAKPFRVLLHAIDGVGKSTWAAGAPNPIFVCSEEGTAHLDVARFPTPKAWADVLEAVRVLTNDEHDFKTLVIDTLDWLEPMCWAHTCAMGGKSDIEAFGFGKGFAAALDHWRALYARLDAMVKAKGMHTILIAHSAIKRVDDPQTGPFDRYRIKLHDRASDLAREWVDAVLFARHEVFTVEKNGKMRGKSNGARVMHTRWSAAFDAKNRFDLPETLPLDWDEFETAARAGEPRASDALRREIGELLPMLSEGERVKAQVAMADWAANNPGRLARLLDKVRAKVSLLEEAGEEGPAQAPAPAAGEPEDDPVPSERPPADAKDPWGLNPTAEPPPAHPPALPTPRADAPVVEAAPAYTPETTLRLTPPDQHVTAPAATFLAETTPKPPPARESPRAEVPALDIITAKLKAHLEGARMHLPDRVSVKGVEKTRAEFHRGLVEWAGADATRLEQAIEGLWKQVPKKQFDAHVEALASRYQGGADFLAGLRAEKSTRARIALALDGPARPVDLTPPKAPAEADDPETVASTYVADARDAQSVGDLDELEAGLRDDPRVGGEHKARAERAISARRVTLEKMTIGGKGGEES